VIGSLIAGLAAALLATDTPVVVAPDPKPYQRLITAPVWANLPRPEDLACFFPEAARKSGPPEGKGSLRCTVTASGAMTDCRIIGETPNGLSFGEAAKAASSQFRLQRNDADNQPVSGRLIAFDVEMKSDPRRTAQSRSCRAALRPASPRR